MKIMVVANFPLEMGDNKHLNKLLRTVTLVVFTDLVSWKRAKWATSCCDGLAKGAADLLACQARLLSRSR